VPRRPVSKPLSRDRVLQAAFAQADADGLDSVTMRSVAARLGVEAMSLYHHVPNKRAVLDGLVDLLIQVADLPAGDLTVEQWVRGTAQGLRSLAQQHPRVVPLLTSRALPLDDPRSAQPFEAGLAAFTREGYDIAAAFAAVQAVSLSLLSLATLEATAQLEAGSDNETSMTGLDPVVFPLLAQVVTADAGMDDFWATLVDALVRGLDRRTT
jgi:AcrR family transcriptional regulator